MFRMSDLADTNESMLGRWGRWYRGVKKPRPYGDTTTYKLAADWLKDCETIQDWGSGLGWFRRFVPESKYTAIDGTKNPFVDKVADLCEYHSSVGGIMMRHVLEHNYDWRKILTNAMGSFSKKFCLIIFTPFSDETHEIAHNRKHNVDVPDIAFRKEDIEEYFKGLKWRTESLKTRTGYGVEHIYYINKSNYPLTTGKL